jgi:starvation-inducible DNA-binding protein
MRRSARPRTVPKGQTIQSAQNTLSEIVRGQSVELLNRNLAAAIDLHAQFKQAHWNVRGPGFIAIHTLFDTVAEQVEHFSNKLAERARGLGGAASRACRAAARLMSG